MKMRITLNEVFHTFLTQRLAAVASAQAQMDRIDVASGAAKDTLTREQTSFAQVINTLATQHGFPVFDADQVQFGRDAEGCCLMLVAPAAPAEAA